MSRVVVLLDQEPATLNPLLRDAKAASVAYVVTGLLHSLYTVRPDGRYVPQLLDGHAELGPDRRTVHYRLREGLRWSDGAPITSADVMFTCEAMLDERHDIPERDGYHLITGVRALDDRQVVLELSRPYLGHRDMFNSTTGAILPRHVLAGADFNTVWTEHLPVSSGPYRMLPRRSGDELSLVRNENYYGPPVSIDEIVFRVVPDAAEQVRQLVAGEADLVLPAPDAEVVGALRSTPGVRVASAVGPRWEHLSMQLQHPVLRHRFVRQAIAHAVDREALVKPVAAEHTVEVLDSVFHRNHQQDYRPHFARYRFDPVRARSLLEENGCTLGPDGIYLLNGFRIAATLETTSGNPLRAWQQQEIVRTARLAGIELTPRQVNGRELIARLMRGEFELVLLGWMGNPDPIGGAALWMKSGDDWGQNYTRYPGDEVAALLARTPDADDLQHRAELLAQAEERLADDMPCLPLYAVPTFLAWRDRLTGPVPNPTQVGPLWNVEQWRLTGEG